MADKPLYYSKGYKASSSSYYGAKTPMYYGGSGRGSSYGAPGYGGGSSYGSPGYGAKAGYGNYGGYGQYGYGQYGGGSQGNADESSLVGTITLSRMLRVVSQRWLSVFVFLLVGLIVAFAVYRISPTIYETSSEFTMDMRRSSGGNKGSALSDVTPDYGTSYAEIFNTRISDWRSEKIVTKILQLFRANHPTSTASDDELISILSGSKLELQRNSRIILITVRSKVPALCSAIANAYAQSIESFTDEENKLRCDKAVSQIHSNVEKQRRVVDKVAKSLLDFRTANKVDNLRSTRETIQAGLSKATTDILTLESEETQLVEWEKMLALVQKDPTSYGSLSVNVPRAQEIATEFTAFQDATSEYQKLLFAFTENHPEVIARKKAMELSRQRFIDAAARALLTGRSTLQVTRNQLANLKKKQEDLRSELATTEQRIVLAESGLGQLEADFGVQNRLLEGLLLDENKARLEAESNNEIVRVGRQATPPQVPVLPNPTMIFGAGIVLSLAFGLLFVLIIDNFEDTIVNFGDIEGRLALKILAVLPHVRRVKREDVAKSLIKDRYSQFSEAIAALRNLLESPRYQSLSKCIAVISTQPSEGKTITSSSIAIAHAQTGKKTLYVDFDMRRPRVAKVWDLNMTKEKSFSAAMQSGGDIDFASLVFETPQPNLSVIGSMRPDSGIMPASIFGSEVMNKFFDWARSVYERIVVDSPPFGLVGDVVSLATTVDSVVIMCCPDRTHFRPIRYCSRSLTEAGANILGVVVNDVDVSSSSAFSPGTHHHHSHYGKYGYGKGGYGYGGYGKGYGYGSYGKYGYGSYGGYGYGGYGYGYAPRSEKSDKDDKTGRRHGKRDLPIHADSPEPAEMNPAEAAENAKSEGSGKEFADEA